MCLAQGHSRDSAAGEARTRSPSISSQAHSVTVLPNEFCIVSETPVGIHQSMYKGLLNC